MREQGVNVVNIKIGEHRHPQFSFANTPAPMDTAPFSSYFVVY
jgi:hypothetical protein